MNILYLTKYMKNYTGASYQFDFLTALKKHYTVYEYGPGYSSFNVKENLKNINSLFNCKIDLIIFSHTFLSDLPNEKKPILPNINYSFINNIPRIFILNKEYVNLKYKLKFIKENKFNLCISHHHEIKKYEKLTNTKFLFLPFAVNYDFFNLTKYKKKYDLYFSGILQNQNKEAKQTDLRLRLMNMIYFSCFDVPIFKKIKYKKYNIYWNSIARKKIGRFLNNKVLLRKRLSNLEYSNKLNQSKICINTLSPVSLVSPRYFESMASSCVILCEKSNIYDMIIDSKYLIQFNKDLSDFDDKFNYALFKSSDNDFLSKAKTYVSKFHTWDCRIKKMLLEINKI